MKYADAHKLLFHLVKSEKLLYEATGWKQSDLGVDGELPPPRKREPRLRSSKSYVYEEIDHDAVKLMLLLFSSLDQESLSSKTSESSAVIPLKLSGNQIEPWAKNMKWRRYEAALLSLGFVIDERSRNLFEDIMYKRTRYVTGNFTPQFYPLFEAFRVRDQQLANSGLFPSEYVGNFNDKAGALNIIEWLQRMRIDLPKGLADRVRHFQEDAQQVDPEPSTKDKINPKERSSMLMLIHAMAMAKFKYKDGESLGPAKMAVYQALQDAGLELSERTIGDYLKAAQQEADRQRDKKL